MTAFGSQPGRYSTDDRDPWWFVVDPFLISAVVLIVVIGTSLVYSATRGPATELDPANTAFLERQIFFAVVGLCVGIAVALIDVRRIRSLTLLGYGGLVVLLLGVWQFGANINGAQAWFRIGSFTFQPSEPGKLVLIVTLAGLLSHDYIGFQRMGTALLAAGVPIGLIMLQPDLGTVLVYIVIVAAMLTMSNLPIRYIVLLVLAALTTITMIFQSDVLKDYQKDRLTVFVLDDEAVQQLGADAVRVAYNAEQSQIAIGNGGLDGKGLFKGTQTSSNLVPFQETDWIFSVAGEELGFRGAGLLLALFAVVVVRAWRAAARATDQYDRMLSVGVMAMITFQVFQSAGMAMGMMPVTGIPMPMVSYGGSSMLTSMAAIGLVLGVHRRRFDYTTRR